MGENRSQLCNNVDRLCFLLFRCSLGICSQELAREVFIQATSVEYQKLSTCPQGMKTWMTP